MKRGKLHPLELFADAAWETYCPVMISDKTAPVAEGVEKLCLWGGFH
jgi:hypothetical protein